MERLLSTWTETAQGTKLAGKSRPEAAIGDRCLKAAVQRAEFPIPDIRRKSPSMPVDCSYAAELGVHTSCGDERPLAGGQTAATTHAASEPEI